MWHVESPQIIVSGPLWERGAHVVSRMNLCSFGNVILRAANGIGWRVSYALHGPRVTIVMPLFNTVAYIEDALASLRAQSYPFFEVLVVDDGSDDGSREVAERFVHKDPRFHLLLQDHQFAGAARNLGLGRARGEFCLFLDSDDVFSPDLVDRVVGCLERTGADIVLFDATKFHDHPGDMTTRRAGYLRSFVPYDRSFSPKEMDESLFQCINPAPWTKAYRTAFIRDAGIQFQGLQNANDLFFSYATLSKAQCVYAMRDSLVWYRLRDDSTQRSKRRHPLAFVEALQSLKAFLVEDETFEEYGLSFSRLCIGMYAYNFRQVIKNDDETSLLAIWKNLKEVASSLVSLDDPRLRDTIPNLSLGERADYELLLRVLACQGGNSDELRKAVAG